MLKIEVNSYNQSALRRIGAALVAMADDIGRDCGAKEYCDPAPTPEEPVYSPEKPADTPIPLTFGPTSPPLDPNAVHRIAPAPPIEDDDEAWADPPGTAPADNLDADGIPWDARIHAGTKTRLKANNTWKLKPGIDKALVDQVKAELMGVQAVVAVPAPPAPAPTLADAAAVSAALQAPPPPPAPAGPTNFAELIKEVTSRITAGQLTPDQVNGAVAAVTGGQLTMCNQLAARQDLIPAVWSVICPTAD